MESIAVQRTFHYAVDANSHLKSVLERPGIFTMNNSSFCNSIKLAVCGGKIFSPTNRHGNMHVSCVKIHETTIVAKSHGPNGAVPSDDQHYDAPKKKNTLIRVFPSGFEALLTEVCDETQIAELKVKLGDFEIHMKRNISGPTVPAPVFVQETPQPVLSKPAIESAPPTTPKSSEEKVGPFTNVSVEKAAKLAALEAGGSDGYVIISSPMVGKFSRFRTIKGKKQPPACKEGDLIKEGQAIGFLNQFGNPFPVKSDVAGEVLKVLCDDEEPVGYGDPLLAILPSFPGIK